MITVTQKVSSASVTIDENIVAKIGKGLVVLIGITHDDNEEDLQWLVSKIVQQRIFNDDDGKMNLSIQDVGGDIIVVSQFTLYASVKKGNRPSYIDAARPEVAMPLYEKFLTELESALGRPIQKGVFGADMKVALINDGPVTILMDSKNRK